MLPVPLQRSLAGAYRRISCCDLHAQTQPAEHISHLNSTTPPLGGHEVLCRLHRSYRIDAKLARVVHVIPP